MIALAALALLTASPRPAGGGELTFPTGPGDPGVIRLRVVDRNRVPIPGALVRGVLETTDGARLLRGHEGHAGRLALADATTAEDGRAVLAVPAPGWCGVAVERSGFASGSFLPLFAGRSYELVLDFGAAVRLVVEDERGNRRGAELRLAFEHFPPMPSGADPVRLLATGAAGIAGVDFVPRGSLHVEACAADGARGTLWLSVGSAWRYNAGGLESPGRVVLHPTGERRIPVADREGRPVDGLRARVSAADARLGAAVTVESGAIRVRGVPPAWEPDRTDPVAEPAPFPLSVELWAPGYRWVQLSVQGEEPPSAFTFRYPLRSGVRVPPTPRAGALWTPLDPHSRAPWEPRDLPSGATPELDVAEGFSLVGALVADGCVAAWLASDPGGAPAEPGAEWLEPGAVRARVTIDGHPACCALLKLELVASAVGGPVPASLSASTFTWADPDGACEIGGLFPGRWRLTLSTHLVHSASVSAEVDVVPGAARDVEIRATRGRDLPGRIVDAAGEPVPTGTVTVLGTDRATVAEGVFPVRPDGTFVVTGLVEGYGYVLRWDEAPWALAPLPAFLYRPADGGTARSAQLELQGALPDEARIVVPPRAGDGAGH